MKLFFRIAGLLLILSGTLAQEMGFDLSDALDNDEKPKVTPAPPKKDDGGLLDLSDALGGEDPFAPKPPVVKEPSGGGGGGGGSLSDSDLFDVSGGHYEPDGGKGRAVDPGYDSNRGDQPVQEEGQGKVAGILSAVGVALVGAASSYFAYQKKKLCFKVQGGQDPERGNYQTAYSQPAVKKFISFVINVGCISMTSTIVYKLKMCLI
ncbi:hypothetical protein WMY93_022219 [Mugilogobius chulae]|uniref:CD99 molecule n=1 Tax=Mugilogobius chulae TaxID=88201 RepID=A0AAW0NGE6_9GOBI